MSATRDELLAQIADEEARLVALEHQRDEARTRLEMLRQQLVATAAQPVSAASLPLVEFGAAPTTPLEKVRLFRSLFRGREDVFPVRFVSKKTGKPGYAPACANKWLRGVCELPRIKCGECPNQAFLAVADQAILDHLRGRHVMGVYPLLTDETCWFLAADFDKASWKDDAAAFVETCRMVDVPVAIERSRSGNGAHAWFFFAAPVPASAARKMGCYLITETMAHHHQLSMESYDRLFPNQDTTPRGGFGNLIALPFQYEARKDANTAFLSDSFEPWPDQWAFLASVVRMQSAAVERLAKEATQRGQVLGVQLAEPADEPDAAPWTRRPLRRIPTASIPGPLPKEVRAVLAQRLFIEKAGLPSPLLNAIKRLAAFQNPEFYKKQSLRLSTAMTPRVIACAEEFSQHIALPRGCRTDLEELLKEHCVALVVDDQRQEEEVVSFDFDGELTAVQEQAARAVLQQGRSPILLTERRDHLEYFAKRLKSFVQHLVVLQGRMTSRERRKLATRLIDLPDKEERLVLSTGRYVGEGFDDARLDTLFLAMPISWKETLVQYAGRLHRLHAKKTEVRIYDYVDRQVPMLLHMFAKRLRTYRAIGYARGEAPLGYGEVVEPTVNHDEETLRYFGEDM